MAKVKQDKILTSIPEDHALVRMVNSLFEWQKLVLQSDNRYAAVLCHRGAGKTALIVVMASLYALGTPRNEKRILMPEPQIMILGPEKGETIKQYGPQLEIALEGLIVEKELNPEKSISYVKLINGAVIRLDGLSVIAGEAKASGGKDAESLRGKSIDLMLIDEIGIIEIEAALAALLPTLERFNTKGSLTVFGTPKSQQSSFFRFWDKIIPSAGGLRVKIPLTHELSPFTAEQKENITRMYQHVPGVWETEYMLEFKTNDTASVYGETVDHIYKSGRLVSDNEISFTNPTFVAMDLGFNDDTAMILYQVDVEGNPVIIDYYTDNRKPIDTYIDWIASKSTVVPIKCVYLPHDSNAQVIGRQFTIADQFQVALRPLGIKVAILKKATKVAYEIPIVKTILGRTTVLERCKPMLEKLRDYAYEPSKVDPNAYTDVPAARQDDHVADAVRYFSMAFHSRYANMTKENKELFVKQGLLSAEYLNTREGQIREHLRSINKPKSDSFRARPPIKITRR